MNATPGQAAYEAYVMAAPDDLNFDEWEQLPEWQQQAIDAGAQAGYEQRFQNDAAAQEPHAAPGESSPLGLKHAVTSNRLGHALAALREIRDGDDALHELVERARTALADDAAIRDNVALTREPQPAPELAAAMRETRKMRDIVCNLLDLFGQPDARLMQHASVTRATLQRYAGQAGVRLDGHKS